MKIPTLIVTALFALFFLLDQFLPPEKIISPASHRQAQSLSYTLPLTAGEVAECGYPTNAPPVQDGDHVLVDRSQLSGRCLRVQLLPETVKQCQHQILTEQQHFAQELERTQRKAQAYATYKDLCQRQFRADPSIDNCEADQRLQRFFAATGTALHQQLARYYRQFNHYPETLAEVIPDIVDDLQAYASEFHYVKPSPSSLKADYHLGISSHYPVATVYHQRLQHQLDACAYQ